MLTIRIGVIAAAFLVLLPSTWAQARDCERYPALCEPPAQATAATDPAPRATPVQKRKARVGQAARRSPGMAVKLKPSQAVAREQPDVRASPEPAPRLAAAATTVLDAAVMLPQPLADSATALATDGKSDGTAPAADAPATSPPTDDVRGGAAIELAPRRGRSRCARERALRRCRASQRDRPRRRRTGAGPSTLAALSAGDDGGGAGGGIGGAVLLCVTRRQPTHD